jgi:hypothetical protein
MLISNLTQPILLYWKAMVNKKGKEKERKGKTVGRD